MVSVTLGVPYLRKRLLAFPNEMVGCILALIQTVAFRALTATPSLRLYLRYKAQRQSMVRLSLSDHLVFTECKSTM